MKLEEFNSKYVYVKDIDKYGFNEVWVEPTLVDGKYEGDCEDYCIFLKRNIEEFYDWDYYYCKINGNGHCVLIKDNEIIDCNIKKKVSIETYSRLYNMTNLKKYNKFVITSKLIVGKITTLVLGLLRKI